MIMVHAVVSHLLPPRRRKYWRGIFIINGGITVNNNFGVGARVEF